MPRSSALYALERLREGNRRFVAGIRGGDPLADHARRGELLAGQDPFAIVLGCSDSRVPAELVFDQGLGDLFVIRVAGNIVASSQIGSVEFATERFGTRLAVVLGHSRCGAVKGACDHVEMGNLTELLSKLQPSVYAERETADPAHRSSKNARFVENVAAINVRRTVKSSIERSFIIEQMVESGAIGVVGAMYDIETGRVEFYPDVEYIRDDQNPSFSVAELRH